MSAAKLLFWLYFLDFYSWILFVLVEDDKMEVLAGQKLDVDETLEDVTDSSFLDMSSNLFTWSFLIVSCIMMPFNNYW